jgi:hypothetical protein
VSQETNIGITQTINAGGGGVDKAPKANAASPQLVRSARDDLKRAVGEQGDLTREAIDKDGQATRAAIQTGNEDLARLIQEDDKVLLQSIRQGAADIGGVVRDSAQNTDNLIVQTAEGIEVKLDAVGQNAETAAREATITREGITHVSEQLADTQTTIVGEVQNVGDKVDQVAQRIDEGNQIARDEATRRRQSEILDQPDLVTICSRDPALAAKRAELVARLRNDPNADPQAAVTELMDFIKGNDPSSRDARALLSVSQIGENGVTLETLISENPHLESQIRRKAVDYLVSGMLYAPTGDINAVRDLLQEGMTDGDWDTQTVQEVLDQMQTRSSSEAQKMIKRYESGDIATLEEFRQQMEIYPANSLIRSKLEAYAERIEGVQDEAEQEIDLEAIRNDPDTALDVIKTSLDGLPEPTKTIMARMLESSVRQRALDEAAVQSKAESLEASAKAKEVNEKIEKFKVLFKYFGPTLIPITAGLIFMASGNAEAGAWIMGLGTGISLTTGGAKFLYNGGLQQWRNINAQKAEALAAIDKARADAGRMEGELNAKDIAMLELIAEIKARKLAAERGGNLTSQQYKQLQDSVKSFMGLGSQSQALMGAFESAMAFNFN